MKCVLDIPQSMESHGTTSQQVAHKNTALWQVHRNNMSAKVLRYLGEPLLIEAAHLLA